MLVKRDGKEQNIPLAAELGATHRFFKEPATDNADVSGRWAVTFTDSDGKRTPAVGEFKQSFHEVTGTFLVSPETIDFLQVKCAMTSCIYPRSTVTRLSLSRQGNADR